MSKTTVTIENDGAEQDVSLNDIANMEMGQVEEFEGGFEPTPKGAFHFRCSDGKLDTLQITDKETGDPITRAVIAFEFEIQEVLQLVDTAINPDDWVGKIHRETIFISDIHKGVGQAKAIMTNAGFLAEGTLQELLDGFVGVEFDAPIGQRKDKNDPDRVYANLKIGKIIPHVVEQVEQTAAAAGGINLGG